MARIRTAKLAWFVARRSLYAETQIQHCFSALSDRKFGTSRWMDGLPNRVFCTQWYPSRAFHGTRPMAARTYYDVLGVNKDAGPSTIKKSYYALAKKLHPDANKDDAEADKKFQEVLHAYEVLKDDEKRPLYDLVGHDAFERAASGGGPSDPCGDAGLNHPFEDFFSGGRGMNGFFRNIFAEKPGGEDVDASIELSFMEAIRGCKRTLTFQASVRCGACNGSGLPPGTVAQICKSCKGFGMHFKKNGPLTLNTSCSYCGGSGKIAKSFCKSCKGNKVVVGMKTVTIDVVPGIDNGETLEVVGCGGASPDGRPGDLYVGVKVHPDPVFWRKGRDIHVDAVLSIAQACKGGNIQVPTLTGDVAIKVKPGTQPFEKVILKGKGIKRPESNYYGDQHVNFRVRIPKSLTQRQRELLDEFVKEEQGDEDRGLVAAASG